MALRNLPWKLMSTLAKLLHMPVLFFTTHPPLPTWSAVPVQRAGRCVEMTGYASRASSSSAVVRANSASPMGIRNLRGPRGGEGQRRKGRGQQAQAALHLHQSWHTARHTSSMRVGAQAADRLQRHRSW